MSIVRQRVVKHIPTEANAQNNRGSFARQRRLNRVRQQYRLCFPWCPCKVDIKESSSEAESCVRMKRMRTRMERVLGSH
jgi:hypothetical protein